MRKEYKLYKIQDYLTYEKYYKMFNNTLDINSIFHLLPSHKLESFKEVLNVCDEKLKEKDSSLNYLNTWNKKQSIFDLLSPAKIDGLAYLAFKEVEKNETILSILNSFKPKKGYTDKIVYNQLKTTTGRLTVNSGPRILTLPKRCRKILKSRWDKEGEIVQIDFKSLEPRIARKILGKEVSNEIYKEIQASLDFPVDRSVIKRETISVLYGKSSNISNIAEDRSNIIFNKLKEYFDIEKLIKIADNVNSINARSNYFGRPIWNIEEAKTNKILNNYIQSTAVDVCLLYFSDLCNNIDLNSAVPLYIIHDALLLDVKKEYFDKFNNIISLGYENDKLGNFPIELTKINGDFYGK